MAARASFHAVMSGDLNSSNDPSLGYKSMAPFPTAAHEVGEVRLTSNYINPA